MKLSQLVLATAGLAALILSGCGGSGSTGGTSGGSILGVASAEVGPSGGSISVNIPTGEKVTIAPGTLTRSTKVSLTVRNTSYQLNDSGFGQVSNSTTLTIDPTAVSGNPDITISGKYTGDVDISEPSNFMVVGKDDQGHIQTLTNLTSTPQVEIDSNQKKFTAHVAAPSSSPVKGKAVLLIGGQTEYFLQSHTVTDPEQNPQIRPYLFNLNASRDQAQQCDGGGSITSDCWTPLNNSFTTDGPQRRIAILVHGINNKISDLSALAFYLSNIKDRAGARYYDQVWGIDHDWQGSIAPRGDQLAVFINAKLGGKDTKTDIFAHSQGTLVTRYALEVSGGDAKSHVGRVFLFAPMNKGIPIGLANIGRTVVPGMGYIGVKEMLREPDEWYKKYWYLLDRLVNDSSQGTIPYFVFTGGDPDSYYGGAMSSLYGNSDHDGIVPWYSSKYVPPSHSNTWHQLPADADHFQLNHKQVIGRFTLSTLPDLNLNFSVFANGQSNLLLNTVVTDLGPVHYTTFAGDLLDLTPWDGSHVALLTSSSNLNQTTMAKILSSLDKAYEYYTSATGREPDPYRTFDGRQSIAEVADVHHEGWAAQSYLGATGTEITPEFFDLLYNQVRDSNQYDQVLFYEFGRNFWFYGNKIEYKGSDNLGVITTGYAVLMRFMAMESAGVQGAPFHGAQTVSFATFKNDVIGLVDLYEANTSLNWSNTLRIGRAPNNSLNLGATDLFASMCLRLARDYGGSAFISRLWHNVGNQPNAATTHDALVNFVNAASAAANTDLTSTFRDRWRWPI